jgi:hypothetical protein
VLHGEGEASLGSDMVDLCVLVDVDDLALIFPLYVHFKQGGRGRYSSRRLTMAAAFPQLLSHCAEGWKGSQVPYVVAEGIEALGTIYVHVRTTPSAPWGRLQRLWLAGLSEQPVRYMYFVLRLGGKGGRHTPHV